MSDVNLVGVAVPCAHCGYDLRGTALGGSCPECGLKVAAMYGGMRVEQNRLVVKDGAVLPARCIKTNEPVESNPKAKTFYWAPSWVYVLILVNLLVLLIVYLAVRKPCRVMFYLSRAEQRKAMKNKLSATGVFLAGMACLIIGIYADANHDDAVWVILGGIALILIGIVLLVIFSNMISITKHRDGEFWIKGCGEAFLASIRDETMAA